MFKVYLDAGHGGEDRWNVGPTGYVEADGMLIMTLALEKALLRQKKFEVELSRRKDETVDLDTRHPKTPVDMAFSLHSNAGPRGGRGTEVFYSVNRPEDQKWAAKMSLRIAQTYNIPNRGAKTRFHPTWENRDYYAVLRNAVRYRAKHAFLSEVMFHSFPDEEKYLKDPKELTRMAEIYCEVICEMFGIPYIRPEDVQPSKWKIAMTESQKWVIENKISDGTNPQNHLTREQAWTMLCNAFGQYLQVGMIKNVKVEEYHLASSWAQTAQLWGMYYGITDGKYPDINCTREQIWSMFYRVAEKLGLTLTIPRDLQVYEPASDYARDAQLWVMGEKISDGTMPGKKVTRVQMWVMIKRFIEHLKKTEDGGQ